MSYPTTFELPTTDGLTGLVASAYFRHLLREELMPAAFASNESLALMLIDTDNFLQLNAKHGHAVGDEVLKRIAETLKEVMPGNALPCRYGGDEFAVALPDTRLDDAFTLAEELRRRLAALTFEQAPGATLTCSIGLAAFPTHATNDVELVREADQALYMAKVTGRNKVALPLSDSRMITKTSYYTATQLERLAQLAKTVKRNEATLLREALDDLLKKYKDRLEAPTRELTGKG